MEQSLVDLKTAVGVETLPGTVGVQGVEESVLDGRVRRGHHLIQGAEVFTDQVKDAGGQCPHLQGKTKSVCVTVICVCVGVAYNNLLLSGLKAGNGCLLFKTQHL